MVASGESEIVEIWIVAGEASRFRLAEVADKDFEFSKPDTPGSSPTRTGIRYARQRVNSAGFIQAFSPEAYRTPAILAKVGTVSLLTAKKSIFSPKAWRTEKSRFPSRRLRHGRLLERIERRERVT